MPPSKRRPSDPSDLLVITSWIRSAEECWLWTASRVAFPIELEGLPELIGLDEHESWTFVDHGEEPIAFGQLVSKPAGRVHLVRVIVAPERRNTGVGRRLAEWLVERALARRPSVVSLNVDGGNEPAKRLYLSLGFRPVERPADESPMDAVYMELTPKEVSRTGR